MKKWRAKLFGERRCPGCAERDKIIEQLKERIEKLERELTASRKRIEELEARLKMSSRNSSLPPSRDPLNAPPRPRKPPSGRKPGGQPGHEGHTRELLPIEKVDEVFPRIPTRCQSCGKKLRGQDPSPIRHQVTEIPQTPPHVTEYQLHSLVCKGCGTVTAATLPEGVPAGAFGPRLQAIVAICSGLYHLSKRTIEGLMGDLYQVPISLGSVSSCEQAVSQALERPYEEASQHVERQAVGYTDETGWREARKKAWLWAVVTARVTVFLVHLRRSAEAAQNLLGTFSGVLVSDRWKSYNGWPLRRRQICWAHLIRDFTRFLDFRGESKKIGQLLLDEAKLMFQWWHRVRDGTLSRSSFQVYMSYLRFRVRILLVRGSTCRTEKTAATCRDLISLWPALWTFVRVEGVEPTNNAVERALRPAVLWRKGCFGTHSPEGSRFVERILTAAATLKQQGRNVVEFVTQACQAQLLGEPAPSLLPVGRVTVRKTA